MLDLRPREYTVAAQTKGVGALEETLKWGQPSYLTPETKSGTTLRLAVTKTGGFCIFVPCTCRVVPHFYALLPQSLCHDGTRDILFDAKRDMSDAWIDLFITSALTCRL